MENKIDVEITNEGTVAIVAFETASISDPEAIAVVSQQIKRFVEESFPKSVVFDFERVKFFSSQVLGLLLDIRAKVQAYSGEVVVSAIEPQLHRIFRITNLDKIFKFFPNRKTAVAALKSKGKP